jgi:hypothetical protein
VTRAEILAARPDLCACPDCDGLGSYADERGDEVYCARCGTSGIVRVVDVGECVPPEADAPPPSDDDCIALDEVPVAIDRAQAREHARRTAWGWRAA